MAPGLSIVVPAYNEAARIGRSLEQIRDQLEAAGEPWELVVVDDGSTDATAQIVRDFAAATPAPTPIRLLQNGDNRGKGFSVRRGLLEARGEVALFTDADLSAPISEAAKLLEPIATGTCDVSIGSRAVDRALITRPQALPRDLLGRCFNLAIRAMTGLRVHDTQCGFKAFRMTPLRPLIAALRIDGFAFDVELLALCAAAELRLQEIPVSWHHVDGSKVAVLRDGAGMLADTAAVVRRLRRGDYADALRRAREAGNR